MRPAYCAAAMALAFILAGEAGAQGQRALPQGYAAAAALTTGSYACRDGSTWTSRFAIIGEGAYEYRGTEPMPGAFTFEPASGVIEWTSGPFATEPGETDTVTGYAAVRQSDGHAIIFLNFRSPAYGESTEICALVTG